MQPQLSHTYSPALVALSVVIAILAAYTALDLSGRVHAAAGRGRAYWILGGATAMGVGIWSMHFVGMLAYRLPMPVMYASPFVALSVVVAIGASAFALWVAARPSVNLASLGAAAVAMGIAIAGMHYIGMAAMQLAARIQFNRTLWWLSIAIAIVASFVALTIARLLRASESRRVRLARVAAAIVMGFAIAGMHYTGMAAARFMAMDNAPTTADPGLPAAALAMAVAIGGILVVGLALMAAMIDRLVRSRTVEAELRAGKESAERTNRAKSEFLSNMSHELRTPLNSVIGFANILLKNKAGNLSPHDIAYLSRITANGSHLLGLINGVLDLSKIEAGHMQLDITSVDLAALVRETLAELEPQARAREIQLVADAPADLPLLEADRTKLKQMILNLVGNALKFTERGMVTVRITADAVSGCTSRIDIVDTGIGIPAARLAVVFDAFQQADNTTSRQYGGTGLGLTITRSLAHLMGFAIEVDSEVGVGSTFSVVMGPDSGRPMQPKRNASRRAAVEPVGHAAHGGDGHSFLVLIIDDDSDARVILRKHLEELGCSVMTAASADEGIALARTKHPDLITMDVMLPEKNGWEALRELKMDVLLRDIPVVVVSAVADENRGRLFGAVDCLDKPVTQDALARVIRRNVGQARSARVLLVHDDPSDLHLYRELALSESVDLEVVTGIDAARTALNASRSPDLIVLDASAPDAQVTVWVSVLRDHPHALDVPVVVVVSDALARARGASLEFGGTVLPRGEELATDLQRIISGFRHRQGQASPHVRVIPA